MPHSTYSHRGDAGPFTAVESSFRLLCSGPSPLAVPAGAVPGLPDRPVPLDELRDRLLDRCCGHAVRDTALGWLLARARSDRDAWLVGLAGVLLPGLRAGLAGLVAACPRQAADLEAEALLGLLEAVERTEPGHPRAAARLCWLARNRARRLLRTELAAATQVDAAAVAAASVAPAGGHPDLVLLAAVEAGVLGAADAALIADTRLGLLSVAEAAGVLGVGYKTAHQRRRRAEAALVAWLTDPDHEPAFAVQKRGPSARCGEEGFVEPGPGRACSSGGGRPRTGRGADRRPAVRHPLPIPDPRR